jgi:hypothetical protein
MGLMLVNEQPKAIKTEGPGWPGSTGGEGPGAGVPAERNEPSSAGSVDARAFQNCIEAHGCARSTAVLRQPTSLQVSPTARPANMPRPQTLYRGTCDQKSILLPR